VNILRLDGCTPEPLASYLKALAVLRLVSEQRDPDARGWWDGDAFVLESNLNRDALVQFVLEDYRPAPLLAPWGARSGFYPGSSESAARAALDKIEHSTAKRLRPAKQAITLVRDLLVRNDWSSKPDGEDKFSLLRACRAQLPDDMLDWLDAVYVLIEDGGKFPPILGTGGNEGSQGYSSNFFQSLVDLGFCEASLRPDARTLLRHSLFADSATGFVVRSVGQSDPGRAGGFNQGPGIEQKHVPINLWNFVLAMEGTLVWRSSLSHRQGAGNVTFVASPFTVRASPVGYSSSAQKDGEAEKGERPPVEIWTPLWDRPASYPEVRTFLGEGRAEVGARPARQGIEFAEAASSLGVDRGISQFVRYALLKRRGKSYVALPVGRFSVQFRSESDLIRELTPLTAQFDGFVRGMGDNCPASLKSARRNIDSAIYELLLHGGPSWACALIRSFGALEQQLARRSADKNTRRPLGGLSPRWVESSDDGSIEFRLAAALASISGDGKVGPLRANLSPIDPVRTNQWSDSSTQTAWRGNSLAARLAEVLARRMMDAERLGSGNNPVSGALRLNPHDIAAFIGGEVNEQLLEDLLFGFTWVNWRHQSAASVLKRINQRWSQPVSEHVIPRAWALLKLLFLPGPLRVNGAHVRLRAESSIVPLLRAGRIGKACEVAARRLYTAGLTPLRARFPDTADGHRIAAALIFPVRSSTELMALVVAPPARNQEGADV
jgi:CRISPR-associated protein Csx17